MGCGVGEKLGGGCRAESMAWPMSDLHRHSVALQDTLLAECVLHSYNAKSTYGRYSRCLIGCSCSFLGRVPQTWSRSSCTDLQFDENPLDRAGFRQ